MMAVFPVTSCICLAVSSALPAANLIGSPAPATGSDYRPGRRYCDVRARRQQGRMPSPAEGRRGAAGGRRSGAAQTEALLPEALRKYGEAK